MISPFISAIGALAPCLCLLLALFLFAAGGPLKRVNRYLAMFLLLAGMDMAGWAANLLPMALRETLIFRLPLCYLQAPLLYVYASKLCFPARRVSLHLWAAAATVVVCILSMAPRAWAWWSGVAPALSSLSSRETDLVANAAVLHAQYYIYIALMLHRLLEYRRTYRSSYSNPDGITFAWLSTIVGTSLFAHTFLLLKSLAWISDRVATYHALDRVVAAIAMLAVCGLTLAALLRQHLFLGVTTEPDDTGEPAPIVPAPVAVVIAHHEAIATTKAAAADQASLARLRARMEREQPFLDPELTIRGLAHQMGMGQRDLSRLINQQLGVHFFDFVNRYRVEHAAVLLCDPAHQDANILDIAYRSGFNTKSSFNAAFGKHLGTTPTALRRQAVIAPALA